MKKFKRFMPNQQGFTMMDGLVALFLNSLTILTLTFLIHQFQPIQHHFTQSHLLSEHWFAIYLERALMNCRVEQVTPSRLIYTDGQRRILIEFYTNRDGLMIRRRTQQGGHEVLLNHLESGSFQVVRSNDQQVILLTIKTSRQIHEYKIPFKKETNPHEEISVRFNPSRLFITFCSFCFFPF